MRFYYKIDVMATSMKLKKLQDADYRRIARNIRLANILCALAVLGVLGFVTGITIDHESYKPIGDFDDRWVSNIL